MRETERENRIFLTFPSPPSIVLDSIRVRCLRVEAGEGGGGRQIAGGGEGERENRAKKREKDGTRIRGTAPFFNHAYPRYNIISTVTPLPDPSPAATPPCNAPRDLSRGFLSTCTERRYVYVGRTPPRGTIQCPRFTRRSSSTLLPSPKGCCCADKRRILCGNPCDSLEF